jgi:hypothetical protein
MRKDQKKSQTRIDDNIMFTFSHCMWLTVKTVETNMYCDFMDEFDDSELDTSLYSG